MDSPQNKICGFCKTVNVPTAVICKKCGSPIKFAPGTAQSGSLPPPPLPPRPPGVSQTWMRQVSEEGLWFFCLASFLIPLVGAILFFLNRASEPFKASACKNAALCGVFFNMALSQSPRLVQNYQQSGRGSNEPPLILTTPVALTMENGRIISNSITLNVVAEGASVNYTNERGILQTVTVKRSWTHSFDAKTGTTISLSAINNYRIGRAFVAIYHNGNRTRVSSCGGVGCTTNVEYVVSDPNASR